MLLLLMPTTSTSTYTQTQIKRLTIPKNLQLYFLKIIFAMGRER